MPVMSTSFRVRCSALAAVALGAAACASAPSTPPAAAPTAPAARAPRQPLEGELPARESLPPEAREALVLRMARHGEVMTFLLASVVFLSYDDARSLAIEIVEEPKLGRPAPGERDTLNALLPEPFFEYQDQLAIHAADLAAAAQDRHDEKLVAAFGAVARTCVACHAAYLDEESDGDSGDEHEPDGDVPAL